MANSKNNTHTRSNRRVFRDIIRQRGIAESEAGMSYASVMDEGDWIQLRINSTMSNKRETEKRRRRIQKARAQCRQSKHTSF